MQFQGSRRKALSRNATTPVARGLLLVLLAFDAVFITLHLIHKLGPGLLDYRFSLEQDGGHAEIFQYAKTLWIVGRWEGCSCERGRRSTGRGRCCTPCCCATTPSSSTNALEPCWRCIGACRRVLGIPPEDVGATDLHGFHRRLVLDCACPRPSAQFASGKTQLRRPRGVAGCLGGVRDAARHGARGTAAVPILRGVLAVLEDGGELLRHEPDLRLCLRTSGLRRRVFGRTLERRHQESADAASRQARPNREAVPGAAQARAASVTEAPASLRH